jgi:hypothetical protein
MMQHGGCADCISSGGHSVDRFCSPNGAKILGNDSAQRHLRDIARGSVRLGKVCKLLPASV